MSDDLFERYKDALRRGHIAAQGGLPEEALAAYREAIDIAPDRALPYVSLGAVLARLERLAEAIDAFDGALQRAPTDETALRGRADTLAAMNRRSDAADTLDRLAALLDGQGRLAEACDAQREALELAESRDRREQVEGFARRLRSEGRDIASTVALGRALEVLGDPASEPRVMRPARTFSDLPIPDPDPTTLEAPVVVPAVTRPPMVDLLAVAERALDGDDQAATRAAILAAAGAQRKDGSLEAALDTCYLALATMPADPDIHLALAGLYLDRGWQVAAVDKIILLGRLADLAADEATHDRLAMLVAERLPDEPRLAARYG